MFNSWLLAAASLPGGKPTCHRFWMAVAFPHFRFPECVARVPVSLWGPWGCGCVRSTLEKTARNPSQPSARGRCGRALGEFCNGHFWKFQMSRSLVSRGRRGTAWDSDVFHNVSKIVLCGRRNTFATFSEDELQFSWQAQHFGRVRLCSTLRSRVACFLRIALSGLLQVVATCNFRGRRGIL